MTDKKKTKKVKKMKIKSNKICLVGIILILYFSFLFQGNNISLNEEDDKNSKNFVLYSSASNSVFVEWNITFGGSMDDFGMGLALDSSGNAYITGFTNLGGGPPMFGMNLVKYNNSGVQKWNSTWGGWDEEGNAIAVDSADNVFVTGKMENYTGMTNDDMFLMKYDSSGIQQWNRSWGGTWNDEGFGVVVDSAGNVYVTGVLDNDIASENDIFLVKYDNSGELQWDHTLTVSLDDDIGYGLAVDSSDNVYLTGKVYELVNMIGDMILMKYNSAGEQQWNRTWGAAYLDQGLGVTVDSSDDIYITGFTQNFGAGGSDIALVKYDTSGEQLWNRTWGGSMDDVGMGVTVDSYDNVYIAGATESFGAGNSDICLVKYDSSGILKWNLTWGGSMHDAGTSVAVGSSNNIYLTGTTESFGVGGSDMCVVKFASKPISPGSSTIPGYNLFFLIGILSAVVIVLSKKIKNS